MFDFFFDIHKFENKTPNPQRIQKYSAKIVKNDEQLRNLTHPPHYKTNEPNSHPRTKNTFLMNFNKINEIKTQTARMEKFRLVTVLDNRYDSKHVRNSRRISAQKVRKANLNIKVPPNIHAIELRISDFHCPVILCLFIIVSIFINEI